MMIAFTGFNVALLILAAITVVGAFRVLSTRNVIHAAFWLFPVFAGMAGFYLLLGAQFLAAIQVLIYIGAILVLIIFAVTLTRNAMDTGEAQSNNFGLPVLLAALVLLVALVGAAQKSALPQPMMAIIEKTDVDGQPTGEYDTSKTQLQPLEKINIIEPEIVPGGKQISPGLASSEVSTLGIVLLQQYLLPFEIASLLLLAGMIGAIVLARKQRREEDEDDGADAPDTIDAPAHESVGV